MERLYINAKLLYQQWRERSRSNLERARIKKHARLSKYEDMCFDCQQSVEKALKARLVFENIKFEEPYKSMYNI